MAKVTLFRTTDGQLHDTQAKHDKHEARLRAKPALEAMVENTTWVFDRDDGGTNYLDRGNIAQFINDNSAQIMKILSDAQTAKRAPRKPKLVKAASTVQAQSAAFVAASKTSEPAADAYFLGASEAPGDVPYILGANEAKAA
jgi:hypothetical protein